MGRGLGGEAIDARLTADKTNWYRHLKGFSAEMRRHPTEAENTLWQALRNRQLAGVKFRRQHTIGRYIVDFVSTDYHLIIEVDGCVHLEEGAAEYDAGRTHDLQEKGYRTLRFSNAQIIARLPDVLTQIQQVLTATP
ncbi:endonuclease domain-containing protein [Hymenobacter sp. BT186]|uniref:Endonuclease domain-containing protein n=1 Tax=Hymenobacter telluris TaxID=2816474 RepID=A0A939JAE3_9BACT|nr:endonuclease domain-containing protein [Hymenobacter telluris]MBO0359784.1 endonuclease domain-containing protein [Hymenobacter telluris]MBW3375811.1 endonuclease domain-containing protein [Hymenobacter norwichensis]